MDRGTWQATVHGVARVRHDLATKPPPPPFKIKKKITSVGEKVEKLEPLCTVCEDVQWYGSCRKQYDTSAEK